MRMSKLLRLLLPIALMRFSVGEDDGGGAAAAAATKPEPETFSKDYVRELRHESAGYRTKAQDAEKKAQEATDAAAKATKEADDKIAAATTAANDRIVRAELKAEAIKAGMVDLDGLKLADLSKVKLNDAGEVEGAEALMEEMKKAKPYLFSTSTTTTSTEKKPPPKGDEKVDVTKMTAAEYKAHKQELLNKRP